MNGCLIVSDRSLSAIPNRPFQSNLRLPIVSDRSLSAIPNSSHCEFEHRAIVSDRSLSAIPNIPHRDSIWGLLYLIGVCPQSPTDLARLLSRFELYLIGVCPQSPT